MPFLWRNSHTHALDGLRYYIHHRCNAHVGKKFKRRTGTVTEINGIENSVRHSAKQPIRSQSRLRSTTTLKQKHAAIYHFMGNENRIFCNKLPSHYICTKAPPPSGQHQPHRSPPANGLPDHARHTHSLTLTHQLCYATHFQIPFFGSAHFRSMAKCHFLRKSDFPMRAKNVRRRRITLRHGECDFSRRCANPHRGTNRIRLNNLIISLNL